MLPRTRSASTYLLFVLACACGSTAENKNANPNQPDSSSGGSAGSSGNGGSGGAAGGSGNGGTGGSAGDASAGAGGTAGSAPDGGCGDTSSSPDNCGSCGHSCLGGECEGGKCKAVTIATLALGEEPTYIVSSSADIVFHSSAGLRRVAKDGLTAPATLSPASTGALLRGLERSGTWIYSADSTGFVYRSPAVGGAFESLFTVTGTPETLTVLNSYVYFADPGLDAIRRVSQSGGVAEIVTTALAGNAYALAAHGQILYWARLNGNLVMLDLAQLPLTPIKLEDLTKTTSSSHVAIAVSETRVFWSFGGSSTETAAAGNVVFSGADMETLTTDPIWALTTDNTYVYWSLMGETGAIRRRVQTNLESEDDLLGDLKETRGIAVDPDAVYFAEWDQSADQGWIKKVAK